MKHRLAFLAVVVFLPSLSPAFSQAIASKPESSAEQATEQRRSSSRRRTASRGVPKGVQACLDRLIEIASADPLPAYGGQAQQIINSGLLWNDPKSRCSIGDDQSLRVKLSNAVTAWRSKDAGKVRSLLEEVRSAVPQT